MPLNSNMLSAVEIDKLNVKIEKKKKMKVN
jgi:hypothetical protein